MLALRELCRGALSLTLLATGCAVYGPELVTSSEALVGGSGGETATAGVGAAGSGVLGGSGGEAAKAGSVSCSSGTAGASPDMTPPYVRGMMQLPPIEFDLTSVGFRDWVHWGLVEAEDYNHRAGVVSQLLDFNPMDTAAPELKVGGPTKIFWSDGVPTRDAETTNGIQWKGLNQGFELVAPATDEQRRMHLYVGVIGGSAAIKASVSDPEAESVVDQTLESPSGEWNLQMLTLEYGSAAEGSELVVSCQVITALGAEAAVSLHGVAFGAQ
jgi:hypothetical protein